MKKYVQECQTCQQERTFKETDIKHEIKRSPEVYKKVSLDYITKLFRNNKQNLILIIKDQNNEIIHLKIVKKKKKTFEV